LLGQSNVFVLSLLCAPCQKNNQINPILSKINTVPRTIVDFVFENPTAYGTYAREIPLFDTCHRDRHFRCGFRIELLKPFPNGDSPRSSRYSTILLTDTCHSNLYVTNVKLQALFRSASDLVHWTVPSQLESF